jgi:hypothetical protein
MPLPKVLMDDVGDVPVRRLASGTYVATLHDGPYKVATEIVCAELVSIGGTQGGTGRCRGKITRFSRGGFSCDRGHHVEFGYVPREEPEPEPSVFFDGAGEGPVRVVVAQTDPDDEIPDFPDFSDDLQDNEPDWTEPVVESEVSDEQRDAAIATFTNYVDTYPGRKADLIPGLSAAAATLEESGFKEAGWVIGQLHLALVAGISAPFRSRLRGDKEGD